MKKSPVFALVTLLMSAATLPACSSDGVGFGAGVNGIRVNPPPVTTTTTPAPAAITGTTADSTIGSGEVSVSLLGAKIITPQINTKAASDGNLIIGGDPLLAAGNLNLPIVNGLGTSNLVKTVSDTLSLTPLTSAGASSTGKPLLSNGLAPVKNLVTTLTGSTTSLPVVGTNGVVGNVLNGTTSLVNKTVTGLTGNLALPVTGLTSSAQVHQ